MKITFLGATKTVTGSNFLVEAAGKKFLVDCGMYQGVAEKEWENSEPFLFNVHEIDFMLLTHAHIDHSGRIPKLYNEGYRNMQQKQHVIYAQLCYLIVVIYKRWKLNGKIEKEQEKDWILNHLYIQQKMH